MIDETEKKDIILVGLNHTTAPVELRERLAFTHDETIAALDSFRDKPEVCEAMLFSTCNRVEILMTAKDPEAAKQMAKQFISEFKGVAESKFENALYVYINSDAVRHVFRVAASLDSLMVGEPQILGQIKDAFRLAADRKIAGVILNKLLHKTFFISKRVRTETGIGDHAVSISYAAVELAKKIFGELTGISALLIGAGEMAELAIEHLRRNRIQKIYVANRTFERGVALADRFNGEAVKFEEIGDTLISADIIISSTDARDYVLKRKDVKTALKARKHKPLFFIDIAVPRDIDLEINRLSNAYVYDIDDLQNVIEENLTERRNEALKGERIIDEAVIKFRKWRETLDVVPTIKALRTRIETIVEGELEKTLSSTLKNISEADSAAMRRMVDAMVNKILHEPTMLLKENSYHKARPQYLDFTKKLFNLDDVEEDN